MATDNMEETVPWAREKWAAHATEERDKRKLSVVEQAMLGFVSKGVITTAIVLPVTRLETVMRVQHFSVPLGKSLGGPHSGILATLRACVRAGGVRSMWRGLGNRIVAKYPGTVLTKTLVGVVRATMVPPGRDSSRQAKLLRSTYTAGVAGGLAQLVLHPMKSAYVHLAADANAGSDRRFKHSLDVWRAQLRTGGFRSLYSGLGVTLPGIVLYRGIYFGLYDALRPLAGGDKAAKFQLGFGVTTLASVVSYPLRVIQSRQIMSTAGMEVVGHDVSKQGRPSALQTIKLSLAKEGIRGLFRGMLLTMLFSTTGALFLVVFDSFGTRGDHDDDH